MPRTVLISLLVSLGLHALVGMWVKVRPPTSEAALERPDVWSGRGIEIDPAPVDDVPAVEVAANAPPAADTPPAPADLTAPEHAVELEPACVAGCVAPAATTSVVRPEPAPNVKPRRAPKPSAATAVSSLSTVSSASAPASGASAGASGEAFGAVGLPPGVRHLPHAFTRALSQGSWGVAGFRGAPVGPLCEAHVSIAVNEDKTLGSLEYPTPRERDTVPVLCRTMFENAYRLVEHGEFSLDAARLAAGTMRLRIEVRVTDGEPRPESDGEPNALWSESKEAPAPGKPGRSTFVLNSGRRVDAFVNLE